MNTPLPACPCRTSFRDDAICMLTLGPCTRASGAACLNRAKEPPAARAAATSPVTAHEARTA